MTEPTEEAAPEPVSQKTGVCKFFNVQKGFGFIVQDDGGEDIFIHRDQCPDGQNPVEGDALSYDETWDDLQR